MKIKVFSGWSEKGLEGKVNSFLRDKTIEVINIDFRVTILGYYAMVTYK